MSKRSDQLEEVVKRWIRAEYMARLGAPKGGVDYWALKLEAEDEMRELVTGERGFYEAAVKLGVAKSPPDKSSRGKVDKKKQKPDQGGLF